MFWRICLVVKFVCLVQFWSLCWWLATMFISPCPIHHHHPLATAPILVYLPAVTIMIDQSPADVVWWLLVVVFAWRVPGDVYCVHCGFVHRRASLHRPFTLNSLALTRTVEPHWRCREHTQMET